ncbi:hypothetical protein Tco_0761609 [Tanacetum coccineum]
MGTSTQYWNGSDGYAYPVLEWIGWVRLPSIGMDWMGEYSKVKDVKIRVKRDLRNCMMESSFLESSLQILVLQIF